MLVPFTPAQRQQLPPAVLNNGTQLLGRMLRQPMKRGEAFPPEIFYPKGYRADCGGGAQSRLSCSHRTDRDGWRVGRSGCSGLISGCRLPRPYRQNQDIPEVTTVLAQMFEILAIGDNASPGLRGGMGGRMPSRLMSPWRSDRSKPANSRWSKAWDLSLVLRIPTIRRRILAGPSTLRELLNVPPKVEPFVSEIYRAGRMSDADLRRGGGCQGSFWWCRSQDR